MIRAPLIDENLAPVSALVVSNKRYSLCYLTTMKSNAVNECHLVRSPVIEGGRIQAITYPGIGTVLNISIDPKVVKGMTRKQIQRSIMSFGKGLSQAQESATKVAAKRYLGQLIPMPNLADAGGFDSCYDDWCSGGGDGGGGGGGGSDYWPDEPTSDNGGTGYFPGGSGAPDGSDDGGGYPNDAPIADDSGSDADDQVLPFPVPTIPPGPTPNEAGGTTNCFPTANGGTCIITAPDPNRIDPDAGAQLPPNTGDSGWSWCDLPIISWFCGQN